jgi:hypothetical protein
MRHWLIVGFVLALMTATCAAQASPTPRVKHFPPERPHTAKRVVVAKTPPSSSDATLKRLEQQESAKFSASPKAKRTPGAAAFKPEKQKPAPKINFSGSNAAKGPGTTNQGTNPYKGRLRQKGAH